MKVRLSFAAEDDLEAIGDYIAEDNPDRALSFVQELRGRCAALGDTPLAYMERRELGVGLRACPHGSYLIFYRLRRNEVFVARVIHAARDLRDLARRGEINEPRGTYGAADFEALGFLRIEPVIKVTAAGMRRVTELLMKPPAPTKAMRRLMQPKGTQAG